MSRTAHHIGREHWNVKRVERFLGWETEPARIGNNTHQMTVKPRRLIYKEEPREVGHELYDLRFFSGCKRVPKMVRRVITKENWLGHGGTGVVQLYAKEFWGSQRAASRSYGKEVVKCHRSGAQYDDILEPDSRTRHSAIWLAW